MDIWIVSTTVANASEGQRLAQRGVEESEAACAQVEEAITSIFYWEGKLHREQEARILFKVGSNGKTALLDWLRENHPYKVPEILAWPAESGDPAYAEWVEKA
jgi:periplasmic divalent cation tolerance protein